MTKNTPAATERFPLRIAPVAVLEDRYETGTQRAHAPENLIAWYDQAFSALDLNVIPDLEDDHGFPPSMPPEIEVFLCSRETAEELFEQESALGVFVVTTPDTDIFDEEASYARRLRVLIISEKEEMEARLTEEIQADGHRWNRYVGTFEAAEAGTGFHEIAHAVLFAKNSCGMSPQDVDTLSDAGDLGHDIFDMTTGYGIRPLPIDGEDRWAEDMDEAREMMESWCEAQGRRWYEAIEMSVPSFYKAAEIDPEALAAAVLADPEDEPAL